MVNDLKIQKIFSAPEVIVLHTPVGERKYLGENRFQLSLLRKKNKKFVKITLWIEERQTTFFIGKAHSERP